MHRFPSDYSSPSNGDSASSDAMSGLSSDHTGTSSIAADTTLKDIPGVFLMGLSGSGKSSAEAVVFNRLQPFMTNHIESTHEVLVKEINHTSLVNLQVLDFPGGYDFSDHDFSPRELFQHCSVLVFVVDAQDRPYTRALDYAVSMIQKSHAVNPDILYRVFVNKMDEEAFYDSEAKLSTVREIESKFHEILFDLGLEVSVQAFVTSIYDDSIFDACSRIMQLLVPPSINRFLENMLSTLAAKCCMENVFLFDVVSRLYLATNDCPHDVETDSLATHVIDVVLDVSSIYGGDDLSLGFDEGSRGAIGLDTVYSNEDRVILLREVGRYLAIVCVMQKADESTTGIIEQNIKTFRRHLEYLFDLQKEANARGIL